MSKKTADELLTKKALRVRRFNDLYPTVRFKGQLISRVHGEWQQLTQDLFEGLFYDTFGGLSNSSIKETFSMVRGTASDRSSYARYIGLGDGRVWDMTKAEFTDALPAEDCIYASPASPSEEHRELADKFLLDVANGDEGVVNDIVQSMAPLLLTKKPSGVIWWQGRGANGKTATMDVLYKLFPGHLSGLTLKQLEDERDTPVLNGKLGNIVRESSEGRIEDSRTYKAVGTHEPFFVHKFHSQDLIEIDGTLHHIFSTNNMPSFADKTEGARRRTLIVQFRNKFTDDPTFEERTFTSDFLNGFLQVLIDAAKSMRDNGYKYDWSETTQAVKSAYDEQANSSESFAKWLVENDVAFFVNFKWLNDAYVHWCANYAHETVRPGDLRSAVLAVGYRRSSIKINGKNKEIFRHVNPNETRSLNDTKQMTDVGMHGLFSYDIEKIEIEDEPEQMSMKGLW